MQKEEILARSRKENEAMDEREASVLASAGKLAAQVGMLLCCATAVAGVIFQNRISFESWTIYFGMVATLFLYKYRKLKARHELWLSVLFSALFLMFGALFVNGLF